MKQYKPSNNVSSGGYLTLAASSILGGTVVGGIALAVGQLIYLIVLFPLVMGLGAGFATKTGVKQGKVRNPGVGILFGLLAGVASYGTMTGGSYIWERHKVAEEISQAQGVSYEEADQFIDTFLEEEVQDSGFVGFMKLEAQEGVGISYRGNEINLTDSAAWIYWSIEVLVITIMAAIAGANQAKEPFCEEADRWYGAKEAIGSVLLDDQDTFLKFLQSENYTEAGSLIKPLEMLEMPNLEIGLRKCLDSPSSERVLTIHRASTNNKGAVVRAEVQTGLVSPRAEGQLIDAMKSAVQADVAAADNDVATNNA